MQDRINAVNQTIKQVEQLYRTTKGHSKDTIKEENKTNDASTGMKNYSIDHVTRSIEKTIQTVEKLPAFQSIVNDLTEKQKRLDNRRLTIAMFGAFRSEQFSF